MKTEALLSALAVALLPALTHLVSHLSKSSYFKLAVVPRRSSHILQVVTYPLVHLNYRHLWFNCIPLLLLGLLIALRDTATFWLLTVIAMTASGWGTWLFSTADRVAGASGLVFGYWGFIIASAALTQDSFWTAAAVLTLLVYASLWQSLMRIQGGMSWAGHFWGLVGGLSSALLIAT